MAAAPGRHDHAVGDGQGTEVADPQPPLLDGAAEEPAVDADLGPATVDERAGGLEIGLPSPVAVGPGGRHAHAGPVQVDEDEVHVDQPRLRHLPVHIPHPGESMRFGGGRLRGHRRAHDEQDCNRPSLSVHAVLLWISAVEVASSDPEVKYKGENQDGSELNPLSQKSRVAKFAPVPISATDRNLANQLKNADDSLE